jgi:hypothetical protein
MPRPAAVALLLAACAPKSPVDEGALRICLDDPAGLAVADGEGGSRLEVEGELVQADGPVGDCPEGLVIATADGDEVGLGIDAVRPAGGGPFFRGLTAGDPLTLVHREVMGWGTSHGFVLRSADGALLRAGEDQGYGPALDGELDLEVALGEALGDEEEPCVTWTHHALDFAAGTRTVSLAPGESGTVDVEGQALQAEALVGRSPGPGDGCTTTDLPSPVRWLLGG